MSSIYNEKELESIGVSAQLVELNRVLTRDNESLTYEVQQKEKTLNIVMKREMEVVSKCNELLKLYKSTPMMPEVLHEIIRLATVNQ
jgi:hypothetical protein